MVDETRWPKVGEIWSFDYATEWKVTSVEDKYCDLICVTGHDVGFVADGYPLVHFENSGIGGVWRFVSPSADKQAELLQADEQEPKIDIIEI